MIPLLRLWVLCVLAAAALCAQAHAADCRIATSTPVIDFGRLSRATMAPVARGLSPAPRTFRVDLQCADASDIGLAFRADALLGETFGLANKGRYTLLLHDATLDGMSVDLGYVDGTGPAARAARLALGPGQRIGPVGSAQRLQGRAFSVQVDVQATFADTALEVRDAETWSAEGTFEASAGVSAALRVEARAVAGSCRGQLSGDIDFGRIVVRDLARDVSTAFEARTSPSLRIECDSPTRFALRVVNDNRHGTAVRPVGQSGAFPDEALFGVGKTAAGENIGSYVLLWGQPGMSAQGRAHATFSMDGGLSWSAAGSASRTARTASYQRGDRLAYALEYGTIDGPSELRTVTLPLSARLHVAPSKDLSLGEETPIRGSATIEIIY